MNYLIEFRNVCYRDDGKDILKDISLTIEPGDFISIVGPSGSGKSTFLKLCSHLKSPSGGEILFKGKPLNEYDPANLRKSISYCFQTPYLFGNTVMDNIRFPYTIRNMKPEQKRIDALFSMFKMSADFLGSEVKNLSGGEKQRIALIRSLIFLPEVLLLDEVTSALDADNTSIVEDVISRLNREGITILWVTHHPEQSRRHANKLMHMVSGRLEVMEVLK